ncbi:hypothetical protein CJF31_00001637 [Rutstroemia sp. NJR-2017a BVV2]|nr:hypothetical protein CJF31_00001637 [Rutstroemia sp. NJR-2017a BVV2]
MKLITALLIFSCALFSIVQAADFATLLAALPTCANIQVNCFVPAVEASGCSTTNATCICTNAQLNLEAKVCMAGTCTVVEQLSMISSILMSSLASFNEVAKLTEAGCGVEVDTSSQTQIRAFSYIFCILSEIFILIRLWVKWKLTDKIGVDDWLMILAANPVVNIGFGLNMWDIDTDNLNDVFHLFMVDECVYIALLAVTKLSLLLFVQKLFPARSFRIATWIIAGFTVAIGITFIMTTVFSCDPIPYFWTKWNGVVVGKCNDVNLQTYIAAGFNILQDFTILFLPLPELWKLQVSMRKKVQLFIMFGVGLFVSIISIIRLRYLVSFGNTTNPTMWSVVETQTGIICACLPSVRHLLKHVFPEGFLSSLKSSHRKGTQTKSGTGTGSHSHKIWQSRSFKIEKHDEFHELDDYSTTDLKMNSTVLTSVVGAPDGVSERGIDDGGESGRPRNGRGV